MAKNKDFKKELKEAELIDAIERYSLYYNKVSEELVIHDGKDIYSASLLKLGKIIFGEDESDRS